MVHGPEALRFALRRRRTNGAGVAQLASNGETARVPTQHPATPRALADALARAMNVHDIDAFVSLFAPDYDSQQPAHPDRAFQGREQVRANWSAVFAGVPDFHAELVAAAV